MNRENLDDEIDDDEEDAAIGDVGEDAVLVGSGTFSIDRSRALRKLMRFQLPDPGMYLLMLVRCAVAGGATRISLGRTARGGIQMVFDGEPFTAADLEYPYASLFKRARKRRRRNREMAIALLSLLRLEPSRITLRSGSGKNRVLLSLHSLDAETLENIEEPTTETILTAERGTKDLLSLTHRNMLRRCCHLSPIPVLINGKELARKRRSQQANEHAFDIDGVRGWIAVPESSEKSSSLDIYRFGVFLSTIRRTLVEAQVTGAFNDDRITPNASQSGIVRNARLDRSLAVLRRQVETLLIRLAKANGQQMARAGRLLREDGAAAHWNGRMERGFIDHASGMFESLARFTRSLTRSPAESERRERLDAILRDTLWLRRAAANLLGKLEEDEKKPAARALWQAGLYLDVQGRPLSLAELEKQRRHLGHVPFSTQFFPHQETAFRVLWIASPKEIERLRDRLGGVFNDVQALLLRESRQKRRATASAAKGPQLSQLGLTSASLLIRAPFAHDGLVGEIALPVHRLSGGARVHVFSQNKPRAFFDLPGELRYQAAIRGIELGAGRVKKSIIDAIGEASASLYRSLGQEYEPGRGLKRDEYVRLHLLDYLAYTIAGGAERLDRERWATLARIFRTPDGFWNYERLLDSYQRGETLFFARESLHWEPTTPLFFDPLYDADFLKRLFPEAGVTPLPSRQGVLMLYHPLPRHKEHGGGDCLIEFELAERAVHLAPGAGEGGLALDGSWGPIRVFGLNGSTLETVPRAAYLALIEAVLRQYGAMLDDRRAPARVFLLRALKQFFQWIQVRPFNSAEGVRLLGMALHFPLFRHSRNKTLSLASMGVKVRRGGALASRQTHLTADGPRPMRSFNRDESELLRVFWPDPLQSKAAKRKPSRKPPTPKRRSLRPSGHGAPFFSHEPRARPAPEALQPLPAGLDPIVASLRRIFTATKGRRGVDFEHYPQPKFVDKRLIAQHPRSRAVLKSKMAPEWKAAYLASMLHTLGNRKLAKVADTDDILFQQTLAEFLGAAKEDEA